MAAEAWGVELINNGEGIRLLTSLLSTGIELAIKHPLQDAVVQHAKELLSGSTAVEPDLVSVRSELLEALGRGAQRDVLRSRLRDEAMALERGWGEAFFEMYGDEIGTLACFTQDSAIVRKLLSPLIAQRSEAGLRWLLCVVTKDPDAMEKFTDQSAVVDFRDRLQAEVSEAPNEEDPVGQLLLELARVLGVPVLEVQEEVSEEGGDDEASQA